MLLLTSSSQKESQTNNISRDPVLRRIASSVRPTTSLNAFDPVLNNAPFLISHSPLSLESSRALAAHFSQFEPRLSDRSPLCDMWVSLCRIDYWRDASEKNGVVPLGEKSASKIRKNKCTFYVERRTPSAGANPFKEGMKSDYACILTMERKERKCFRNSHSRPNSCKTIPCLRR